MIRRHAADEALKRSARPLNGTSGDFDPLMQAIGNARLVLLGEASHGTHEFYEARAQITQQLIEEKGFHAVVVEADWPDAYRVNRYVRGNLADPTAVAALNDFQRFPQWMWRNTVVVDFLEWLKDRNLAIRGGVPRAGFYGMDLYSLHGSMQAVLNYLQTIDPAAARRAQERYECFDRYGSDPQRYGMATGFELDRTCEKQVIEQLTELMRKGIEYGRSDGDIAQDEYFFAEQNARLVKNAEEYYRQMYFGSVSSWNLRDTHMVETVDAILQHLDRRHGQGRTKLVLWAHNSHLGDARATEMGLQGELNVGQLVRQKWGDAAFLVGFSTHAGAVTAASNWDGPAERKRVRPSLEDSYERLFHDTGIDRFLLLLRQDTEARRQLMQERLERAIGVIYRPETERISHYFMARLPDQFDAVIHFDLTRALEPIERFATWHDGEVMETYPSGV